MTKRIDLTELEKMQNMANGYLGDWFKGTILPDGEKWRDTKDLGLHVDWSHDNIFGPLLEVMPAVIAELKRCYERIDLLLEVARCRECHGEYIGFAEYRPSGDPFDHHPDCPGASF